jgi:hypothetical protein
LTGFSNKKTVPRFSGNGKQPEFGIRTQMPQITLIFLLFSWLTFTFLTKVDWTRVNTENTDKLAQKICVYQANLRPIFIFELRLNRF